MELECEYRNCKNIVKYKRKGAKYCCDNCRKMEAIYRKRKLILLEKYKKADMEIVEFIKSIRAKQQESENN